MWSSIRTMSTRTTPAARRGTSRKTISVLRFTFSFQWKRNELRANDRCGSHYQPSGTPQTSPSVANELNFPSSKCLTNAHAPSPTIPSPREVSPQIDVVFLTEFISRPSAHVGQEMIVPEEYLTRTRHHSAGARECGKANPLR